MVIAENSLCTIGSTVGTVFADPMIRSHDQATAVSPILYLNGVPWSGRIPPPRFWLDTTGDLSSIRPTPTVVIAANHKHLVIFQGEHEPNPSFVLRVQQVNDGRRITNSDRCARISNDAQKIVALLYDFDWIPTDAPIARTPENQIYLAGITTGTGFAKREQIPI
jgi:hypothetical protein